MTRTSGAPARLPWSGRWVPVDGPTDPDVVLSVAARRGVDPSAAEQELRWVGERFDVDEVYLPPSDTGSG